MSKTKKVNFSPDKCGSDVSSVFTTQSNIDWGFDSKIGVLWK